MSCPCVWVQVPEAALNVTLQEDKFHAHVQARTNLYTHVLIGSHQPPYISLWVIAAYVSCPSRVS